MEITTGITIFRKRLTFSSKIVPNELSNQQFSNACINQSSNYGLGWCSINGSLCKEIRWETSGEIKLETRWETGWEISYKGDNTTTISVKGLIPGTNTTLICFK
jgi:hypothetical protein